MALEEFKGVYIYAEQVDNQISNIAFELLGKAKDLAKDLDTDVTAVLVGSNVKDLADSLAVYGADKVRKGAGEKVAFDSADESVAYIMGKLKEKHVI